MFDNTSYITVAKGHFTTGSDCIYNMYFRVMSTCAELVVFSGPKHLVATPH